VAIKIIRNNEIMHKTGLKVTGDLFLFFPGVVDMKYEKM
jgi:hypothetical protein